jgi:hypothetical protein
MITSEDIAIALRPVFNYVLALLDQPNADFFLERRVVFPTIPDTFGTADLLIRIDDTIHLLDFKFGIGIRVLALTPADDDPDVDVLNSQLMFYAAAARHSLPKFFADVDKIVLTVLQPTSIEPDAEMVSTVTVTHAELDVFVSIYRGACEEALSDAPRLEPGAWCRFCPARPICPAHTRPLLDLAQFKPLAPWAAARAAFASPPQKEAYLQILADGLNLVDAIKDIRIALHDQAKHALQSGDSVPGYALSAGRAERHWRDETITLVTLLGLGLEHDDLIELETLRSVKQIELRAKARGLKIPQELIGSHRSGVSLVRSENVRVPVPGRDELARMFSAALQAFQKEGAKHE